ncbi:hypothetical protein CG98_gp201 [Enterobacter phage PG7]|uniref:Uncharacterized protein n=1 Tax=Enterobacter phage PG7 TaxID=1455074 RepID=W6AUP7_9CAUD|nr:hypothetical protein CG98_gp201 [Enterobacter phage PG7]AHI61144.1 hypothetical protein PG7_241 [Enterobacter phage PG7]WFG78956.1 hypothetical protein VIPECLUMC02_00254 [Enterobacter phage vB_VIPECLUMC02]
MRKFTLGAKLFCFGLFIAAVACTVALAALVVF